MTVENLKGFLSYSTKNKRLAGKLKDGLVTYGLDTFLAHDDIQPSARWAGVIRARLLDCDVFLPLLTDQFRESAWTDQETGMALAAGKLIIPLKVDIDPYGFIASIQALKLDPEGVSPACLKIAHLLSEHPEHRARFRGGLIRMFSQSLSFDQAGRYADLLVKCEGFSPQQVRDVLLATIENNQIHQSFKARKPLAKFLDQYGGDVDSALVKKAKAAMRD